MSENIKINSIKYFSERESRELWEIFSKYSEMKEIKLSSLVKNEVNNDLKWLVNNKDKFYDNECLNNIDKLIEWLKYLLKNWERIEINILKKHLSMRSNNLWVLEIESKRFMYQIWLELGSSIYSVDLLQVNKNNDRVIIKNKNNFFILDKALEKIDRLKDKLYKYFERLSLSKSNRIEKLLNHNFNFVKKDNKDLSIFNKTKEIYCKKCNQNIDFEMIITLDKTNSIIDIEIYDLYENSQWNLLDDYMISVKDFNKKYMKNVESNFNNYIEQDSNECYSCRYE